MNVPVEQFGQDHWSLLAYIETRCVDFRGALDNQRLRIDPDRHPMLLGRMQRLMGSNLKKYPTFLSGRVQLPNHDDWDCAKDLEACGFVVWGGTGANPVFSMTDKGSAMVAKLRKCKASGGSFGTFNPGAWDVA